MATTIKTGADKASKKTKSKKTDEAYTYDEVGFAFGEDTKVLGALPAKKDVISISISSYKGRVGLDLRRCYLADDASPNMWRPTSQGIRLLMPEAVHDLIELLSAHEQEITEALKKS